MYTSCVGAKVVNCWSTSAILSFAAPLCEDGGSTVKNTPAKQETWAWSLCQEDPLEKEMATHSSILTWKIPWTLKPGRLQSVEWQRVIHDLAGMHMYMWRQEVQWILSFYTRSINLRDGCVPMCGLNVNCKTLLCSDRRSGMSVD